MLSKARGWHGTGHWGHRKPCCRVAAAAAGAVFAGQHCLQQRVHSAACTMDVLGCLRNECTQLPAQVLPQEWLTIGPRSQEAGAVGVAAAQRMRAAQRHDLLVVEAHPAGRLRRHNARGAKGYGSTAAKPAWQRMPQTCWHPSLATPLTPISSNPLQLKDSFDIDTSTPVEDVTDVLGVLVAVGQAAVWQRHKLVGRVVGAAGAPGDVRA